MIALSIFFHACKKQDAPIQIDFGKNYYPLDIGSYVIYDVDSTVYDELTHIPKTYKYRLKEIITQSFINDEGHLSYRLERYIKWYDSTQPYDQIQWKIKNVWSLTPYPNSLEKREENIPYIKLIFPVKTGAKWNGNARNTLGNKTYTYQYVDVPESVNNITFDKVLAVKQYEYRSLIQYQNEIEKYARNVGMIYKEITNLESQSINPSIPVENRAEKGFIYKMTIVEWGKQ